MTKIRLLWCLLQWCYEYDSYEQYATSGKSNIWICGLYTVTGPVGVSSLTHAALQEHDGENEMELDAGPIEFDAKTFNTWATNFTNCTSLTFSRVHSQWNLNNAMHKQVSWYFVLCK